MELNGRRVLFKTHHGSILYGLAHKNSDDDYYTVVETTRNKRSKYSKQTIVDGVDSTVVDFGTWVNMCQNGVPQACEAMFSQMPVHDELAAFRNAFRVGPGITERYVRTIKSFVLNDDNSYKKQRHGVRLAMNLSTALRMGRFNPTLSTDEKNMMEEVMLTYPEAEQLYDVAMGIGLGLDSPMPKC